MQTFTIYPKDGGEEFKVEFERFAFIEDRIALHDSSAKESARGYLALSAVAAIVPQQNPEVPTDVESVETLFLVYLKGRKEPVKILAGFFDAKHPDQVPFYGVYSDGRRAVRQPHPMDDVYVAKSEVVGIFPSTGLAHKWRLE